MPSPQEKEREKILLLRKFFKENAGGEAVADILCELFFWEGTVFVPDERETLRRAALHDSGVFFRAVLKDDFDVGTLTDGLTGGEEGLGIEDLL